MSFNEVPSLLMGIYSELDNLFNGPLTPIQSEDDDLEDGEIQEPRKKSLVGFAASKF